MADTPDDLADQLRDAMFPAPTAVLTAFRAEKRATLHAALRRAVLHERAACAAIADAAPGPVAVAIANAIRARP